MAKRVWKSIIRRKNKPVGNMAFGALAVTHEEGQSLASVFLCSQTLLSMCGSYL